MSSNVYLLVFKRSGAKSCARSWRVSSKSPVFARLTLYTAGYKQIFKQKHFKKPTGYEKTTSL